MSLPAFLLLLLLVAPDGVTPVVVTGAESREACEAKAAEVRKRIPRDPSVNYVLACSPIRNATATEI